MKNKVFAFMLSVSSFSALAASNLNIETFNPGKDAIFNVSSTLISGDKDAILIDAQFQKQHAKKLVDLIKKSGKNLKYIYISHSDPDYYFGIDEVKKAYPNAKIISTAQTAYLIQATKDAKLNIWKDQLKTDIPTQLVVPEAVEKNKLNIDGQEIVIKLDPNDSAHSFLWIPSLKTIVGGISVSKDGHLWTADTQSVPEINAWIKQIDDMKALNPNKVIPSHFNTADDSPKTLDWVKGYLQNYKEAVTTKHSSKDVINFMTTKYPNLADKQSLELGAKVFKGEQEWHTNSAYPPIGRTAKVNFGNGTAVFDLNFKDNKTMSFIGTDGPFKGVTDTVQYMPIEVAKNVFMVYWHEPSTGSNVVHVQNYNTGTAYTNIAAKDGSFTNLSGTIKVVNK